MNMCIERVCVGGRERWKEGKAEKWDDGQMAG